MEIIAEDSYLIENFLQNDMFDIVKKEIEWKEMMHHGSIVPRLIAIQSHIEDNKEPIYRHPSEMQPQNINFTKNIDSIRHILMEKTGQCVNHVLIQYYKNGDSNIGEHSDKTLDILKDTNTWVISLGSTRTIILKKKIKIGHLHEYIKVQMTPNSLFVLGWKTNRKWYHSINKQKLSNGKVDMGERISLTFRTIATFRTNDGYLYGQGATCKTYDELLLKNKDGRTKLIEEKNIYQAFGKENHEHNFDWDSNYGGGFDLINYFTKN